MSQKEAAIKAIENLIFKFRQNEESYRNGSYNETQLRREFLDPFFEALGWDVTNKEGLAEQYKDVIHEDAIKVGEQTKAPDYSFRVGGQRKFFVEAKKPSVSIKEDIGPAYQVRRYSWSAKLSLAILSDFDELAVYDCRLKPKPADKASVGRVAFYTYDQYLEKFDEIYDLFSKEAVLKGTFDKYAQADAKKKGTTEVDKEFLKDIEHWREILAKNLAMRNEKVSNDDLNYAVQTIIDRIIFLRICEDRNLEASENLKGLLISENIYKRLINLFKLADDRYNAGLFDFTKDQITTRLKIDDKTLSEIIGQMYYPASPYVFSQMPIEILGQVYEQFLGKVIRLTAGHHAKVEEKPEVRKAGGVYYTPQYIVDYIVKNTVGALLAPKSDPSPTSPRSGERLASLTPKEIESIKILDPACGSGSFLIGAYKYLLEYHLNWYTANEPKKYPKAVFTDGRGAWRLTTSEAKKILLNNIFGVDIDSQAVEVTKLSLLLKVLENESREGMEQQLKMFKERALPNIDGNIKCGNSLIGPDFYEGQLSLRDTVGATGRSPKEKPVGTRQAVSGNDDGAKINPFDWEREFPEIMKRGGHSTGSGQGFDAVIGNPPYRMIQPHNTSNDILDYIKSHYTVAEFKIDLFHVFLQKGIRLQKNNGLLGYIIPATLLNNVHVENLREWLLGNIRINKISLAGEKVFEQADVYTCVLVVEREPRDNVRNNNIIKTTLELEKAKYNSEIVYNRIKQSRFSELEGKVWNVLLNEENVGLIAKLNNENKKLIDVTSVNRGLITGDKDKYFSDKKMTNEYVPILAGGDVFRYYANNPSSFVKFVRPKTSGGCWDEAVHFAKHKVVIRQIGTRPTAAIIEKPIAVTGNIFTIIHQDIDFEKSVLGIINSKLIEYYWKLSFSDFKNSFPQVTIFSLGQVPITNKINDKAYRKNMVALVDKIIKLKSDINGIKNPNEKETITRQIAATDKQIDKLVYELYGLTEEEIKVVEGECV
jgi:type I restriction-modification system DNA methylase subunit